MPLSSVHEITPERLARFRVRTAVTNKRAGYHYMALVRIQHGQPALKDASHPRATRDELRRGIGGRWDMVLAFERSTEDKAKLWRKQADARLRDLRREARAEALRAESI